MFSSLFEDTIKKIKKWKPTKKFSKELKYSNDLADFLRDEFNENQSRVSVTKEDGRGLCDIAINKKIGIELKKDLKNKSEIDRLAGQIIDYKKDYEDIIIVLVGDTKRDALEVLKDKISYLDERDAGVFFEQGLRIEVIEKGDRTNERKKPRKDNDDWKGFFPE